MDARRDESGDVRHVDKKQRADGIGDVAQAREVDGARIGRGARRDHLRAGFLRLDFERVIVDGLGFLAHAVVDDAVKAARKIHLVAVREMAAVRQVHGQDQVAGLKHGKVDGGVGLRTGMGLDVDVVGAEKLLRALDGQFLDDIDVFAPAVPALVRVTLGILVGEARTLRFHHGAAGEILRRDQLDVVALAGVFVLYRTKNIGVGLGEGRLVRGDRGGS